MHVCPVIKVFKYSTLLHSGTAQDNKLAFWLNAALHEKKTAGWCHHSHTHASPSFHKGLQVLNTVAQQLLKTRNLLSGSMQLCLKRQNTWAVDVH